MTSYIYHHPDCIAHDPGPSHSERSQRLTAIVEALVKANIPNTQWPSVPLGDLRDIAKVHTKNYIDFVFRSIPKTGYQEIEINEVISDDDGGEVTVLCPKSGEAILRAVGGATSAVDAVMTGKAKNAFCLPRPPGHHAMPDKAMGFCVFGTAAIAARFAQAKHNAKRVAIIDYDVHHGNGTQKIVEKDPSIFFASIHQLPLWPETGHDYETGVGNILNVPVKPDLTNTQWLELWKSKVLARLENEDFDLLIVSAGFDAHKDDPKGSQNLETDDYTLITRDLMNVAERKCKGRIVTILEGGYDITASATSAVAVAKELAT